MASWHHGIRMALILALALALLFAVALRLVMSLAYLSITLAQVFFLRLRWCCLVKWHWHCARIMFMHALHDMCDAAQGFFVHRVWYVHSLIISLICCETISRAVAHCPSSVISDVWILLKRMRCGASLVFASCFCLRYFFVMMYALGHFLASPALSAAFFTEPKAAQLILVRQSETVHHLLASFVLWAWAWCSVECCEEWDVARS